MKWEDGVDKGHTNIYNSLGDLCEVTLRDAADLEMGLPCGLACYEDGRPYGRSAHQWTRFAVRVGEKGWDELLDEQTKGAPQLLLSWEHVLLNGEQCTTPEIVIARARMAQQNRRERRGIAPRQFTAMPRAALNAEDEPLCFMEAFCGQAPLAIAARKAGMKVLAIDDDPRNVWQNLGPDGEVDAGPGKRGDPSGVEDELREEEFEQSDFLDMPLDWLEFESFLASRGLPRRVHWLHLGVECLTFSKMGTGKRDATNYFMGSDEKCYDANLYVQHMIALMYLLRKLYPHVIFSVENPEAALVHHPLMAGIATMPLEDGGLGLMPILTTWCMWANDAPEKKTIFFTNCIPLFKEATTYSHSLRDWVSNWKCGCGKECGSWREHGASARGAVRGQKGKRDTATYPKAFCTHLLPPSDGSQRPNSMPTVLRNQLRIDEPRGLRGYREAGSNVGIDGSHGHCCKRWKPGTHHPHALGRRVEGEWKACTKERGERDGDISCCKGCSRTFHPDCIPDGAVRNGDEFLCDLCAPVGWEQWLQPNYLEAFGDAAAVLLNEAEQLKLDIDTGALLEKCDSNLEFATATLHVISATDLAPDAAMALLQQNGRDVNRAIEKFSESFGD